MLDEHAAEQQQKNTTAQLDENRKTIAALNSELNQLRDKYREKACFSRKILFSTGYKPCNQLENSASGIF